MKTTASPIHCKKLNRSSLALTGCGLAALALMSGVLPATADHTNDFVFRAHETSLDVFGSVSIGQETINHISRRRVEDNGRLGLGLGGNYFFTRYLGLGGDAYTENSQHSFVDNASGNLIFRFPIESLHLAPYVYGGGGYQFDPSGSGFGQAGAGLEFRFTRNLGVFTDARYVMTDGTGNFGVARLGLRLGF